MIHYASFRLIHEIPKFVNFYCYYSSSTSTIIYWSTVLFPWITSLVAYKHDMKKTRPKTNSMDDTWSRIKYCVVSDILSRTHKPIHWMTRGQGYITVFPVICCQGHIFERSRWSSDLMLQHEVDNEDSLRTAREALAYEIHISNRIQYSWNLYFDLFSTSFSITTGKLIITDIQEVKLKSPILPTP